MTRKFKSGVSALWYWVSAALILLMVALFFFGCKTIQQDKDIYVPNITQTQTDYLDSTLEVLNSKPVDFDTFKPLNPRSGKPFTWWQRNVTGTGRVKLKRVQIIIGDNNANQVKKPQAPVVIGDSSSAEENNAGKNANQATGKNNKIESSTKEKSSGIVIPWWMVIVAVLGAGLFIYFKFFTPRLKL